MQLKKGQIVELNIESLAFGGAGIGRYEGRAVFVKDCLPGDRVKASFTRIKPKFAEARLEELVKASEMRITPRCEYFEKCGGCQLQYIPYEKQLEWKRQHVQDCFERIGGFDDLEVEPVLPIDGNPYYYRNKMEFSFGYDASMNFVLGMHLPGRRYDILDLDNCYLQSRKFVEIVNEVREFFKDRYLPYQYSCGIGFLRSLFVREGKRTGDLMVNLSTSDDIPEDWEEVKKAFVAMLEKLGVTSIYWSKVISKRGQPRQVEENLLFGEEVLKEKMHIDDDELLFKIRPQAFFQVNTFQGEKLYKKVFDLANSLGLGSEATLFDLFCGTGTIGMFMALKFKQVYGVEINEEAVKAAKSNAVLNQIENIEFLCGDVAKVVSKLDAAPDLIIVDPPRAGLSPKMIEDILKFNCKNIIYVSCNPSTLARDCKTFAENHYKTKSVKPVDMFPHTYHIENVCLLCYDPS